MYIINIFYSRSCEKFNLRRPPTRPLVAGPSSVANTMSNILDLYEPLDVIGNGSFGIIRKVKRKSDGLVRVPSPPSSPWL